MIVLTLSCIKMREHVLLKRQFYAKFPKFWVYLQPKRDLKSSCQYKISFRMMFCRPSSAILLLARLKIFLFSLHTLTLKIASFLPKFEFLPPPIGETSKAPPISLKFCTRHFLMHVPLFITSYLNFEKKSKTIHPIEQSKN